MLKRTAFALVLLVLVPPPRVLAAAGFLRTGAMATGRAFFPAVTLPDGSVLVASDNSLERYDPLGGSFGPAGTMTTNRGSGLTATLLSNGTVLIVGGQYLDTSQASAEIYDPGTATSTPTGSLSTPRSFHTATLLSDGRVLITGGHQFNFVNSALDTAEVYNPLTGTFTVQGTMSAHRQDHTATRLPGGRVLIAGGYDGSQSGLSSAETFNPSTGTFTSTGNMAAGRGNHTATLLGNGKVAIIGGHTAYPGGSLSSAEVYDPGTGTFGPAGAMTSPRGAHTVTALPDGTLLIVGGFTSFPFGGTTLASAEIYNPAAGTFAASVSLHDARGRHAAAALQSGEVLVAGGTGQCCGGGLQSAEIFSSSVVDTHPPTITVPSDMTVLASGPLGAVVFYNASAIDDIDAAPSLICQPASGATFPVGTTTVSCTATDSSSNTATATFNVTVLAALDNVVTLDASAGVHPKTGLATLSGTVLCSRPMNGYLSGELSQTVGGTVLHGSFSRSFACVPPSLAWIASTSAGGSGFRPGSAQATVSVFGCDALGSCDPDTASRKVKLGYRQPPPSLITITRVADTSTLMPRAGANFSFFSLPFVRKGIVAFLGYGGGAQGIYTGSGGPLQVVADARTRIPGRSGTFAYFDSLTFDGVTLAFQGRDALSVPGLYTSRAGRLARVADVTTPVPGGGATFGDFVGPVLAGRRVAFRGSSDFSSFSSFGVYAGDADALTAIADRQTPVPGGTGNFNFFGGPPALDGNTVVFPASGFNPRQEGIYASTEGTLTTIADLGTPVPGGSGSFFYFFGAPVADHGAVAFSATDDSFKPGLYLRAAGAALKKVVDSRTAVPSQSTFFGTFSDPALDGGIVAFNGLDANYRQAGVYTGNGGKLTTVADRNSPVPGGQGTFLAFEPPALQDGRLAFLGQDSTSTPGLYVHAYGGLQKVISRTDTLDGKDVSYFQFVTRSSCYYDCHGGFGTGFDGTRATFLANFADGSQGLYLATVGRGFAEFTASLAIEKDGFELGSTFRLGPGNDGISLTREVVSLQVGTFSTLIPAGSFKSEGDGRFGFTGTIEGVELKVLVRTRPAGRYEMTLEAEGADLTAMVNPVTVNLAIGDDAGGIAVKATR